MEGLPVLTVNVCNQVLLSNPGEEGGALVQDTCLFSEGGGFLTSCPVKMATIRSIKNRLRSALQKHELTESPDLFTLNGLMDK